MTDDGNIHKFSGVTIYDKADYNNGSINGEMQSMCNNGAIIYKQMTRDNWKVTCTDCQAVLIDAGQKLDNKWYHYVLRLFRRSR